jgi:CTP:phosphocholine cytidylyltransferase-like protein
LEENVVLNYLKRGTTFSIETSSDSKLILNENSGKLLGLEIEGNLMEFLLGTSYFDETWTTNFCLHLADHSTHEGEFAIPTRNSLTWS